MSTTVHERLDRVEGRLRDLQDEVAEIRALATREEAVSHAPAPTPVPQPAAPVVQPPPAPAASYWPPPPGPAPAPRPPRPPRPTAAELLERYDLLGARGLALAGGVVTLLGVVFFYVLAANRGWIGPAERVSLGAIASGLVFGGGLYARRRYGPLLAPFAAVGAGLAGWYTTLAAATILYDLLPAPAALGCAAAIATVGLVVALAWSSELLAGLALLGAAVSPALLALDEGIEPAGTAFAAVVFAALAWVSTRRGWGYLLAAGTVAIGGQAVWTAVDAPDGGLAAAAVTGVVVVLILGTALARQFVGGRVELDGLAGLLVTTATTLALAGPIAIFSDDGERGIALAAAAAVFAAFCAGALRRSEDLVWTVGSAALILATVATAELLTGATLAVVWGAQSAAATLVVARTGAPRFLVAALAYFGLALVHALALDATVAPDLYPELSAGAAAALPVGATALAALALAWLRFPRASRSVARGPLAPVDELLGELRRDWNALRAVAGVAGVLLALGAAGLVLVDVMPSFGHLATVALLAAGGAAAVALGARRSFLPAELGGFVALALAFVKPMWDWENVGPEWGAVGLAIASAAMLAGGFTVRALSARPQRLGGVYGPAAFLAFAGALAAVGELVPGNRTPGVAVVLVAGAFAGLALAAHGRPGLRDLSTTMWVHGLVALLLGEAQVLQSRGIAVAYGATAVGLAVLANVGREARLRIAAWILAGGTTLVTLLGFTPFERLAEASDSPAESLWMLAACVATILALAVLARDRERELLAAVAAALGVYALSLGILEVAVRLSDASLATDFQRGHTAVSAIWGAIGLCVLAAGLARDRRPLRIGGLALLGVALAKLFLYDLSALSSVTRAMSFLAVGIALLAGGLLVQRLTDRAGGPPRMA